jgi:predicted NUDIX family NTP pyrophosphohydrolase
MARISAGILLFRLVDNQLEFFLVHPGGPFFKNKDEGHWTIPKGEPNMDEEISNCALREFREETGFSISGPMYELSPVKQKGGKIVHAWAMKGNVDASRLISNMFELEWPPKSGRMQQFPEIDKASWFIEGRAIQKINPAQQSFIKEAVMILPPRL